MPLPLGSGVVAIVDDDPSSRKSLERSLVVSGYRVQCYASAEQFMLEANAMEISCVVLDIDLGPGLTGLELGRIMSRSFHAPAIVFMTGSLNPMVKAEALEIGCVDFLPKPVDIGRLIDALTKCEAANSGRPGASL
jgi:FixJ family two-component response regulator